MEQQCNAPFKANLCRIDPGLSPHQLQSFKAACITCLGLSRQKLEGATSFVAVYDLIEQARPHNAKALVYQMLLKLNVSQSELEKFEPFMTETDLSLALDSRLDLVLTVAVLLEDMSERRYDIFRTLSQKSFLIDYHVDNITSRAFLLELLVDRCVIDNLSNLFLLFHHTYSSSSTRAKSLNMLRQYCSQHKIEEPVLAETQLPNTLAEGDVVCQLQIEVTSNSYRSGSFRGRISSVTNVINHSNQSVHYNTKGRGFHINLRRVVAYSVFVPSFLLILSLLVVGFYLFFAGTYFSRLTNIQTNSSQLIGANSLVRIFPNQCINPGWIKSATITVHDSTLPNLTVYRGLCEESLLTKPHYLMKNKSYGEEAYQSLTDLCINANYYGNKRNEHYPVYTAGPGTLSYNVQLVNASELTESSCPFVIYIFNDSYYYTYSIQVSSFTNHQHIISERAYAASPCVSMMSHNNSAYVINYKHEFQLKKGGFYYAVYCIQKTSLFGNVTISGKVTKFSDEDMKRPQFCTFNESNSSCVVNVGNVFGRPFTLFAETTSEPSQMNVTVLVTPAEWNVGSITCLSLAIILIVIAVVIFGVMKAGICRMKFRRGVYSSLQ